MAKSGHRSSPPPTAARNAPVSSRLSPVAAIGAEAQKAAEELVVDDFVDTYLRERPQTRNPHDPAPAPATAGSPAGAAPAAPPARSAEESGIRIALAQPLREEIRRPTVEVEAVAVAGAAGEVVALEAELAERDERISSLEEEVKRLRDSVSNEAERTVPVAAAAGAIAAAPAVAPPSAAPPVAPAAAAPAAPASAPSRTARLVGGGALLVAAAAALVIGVRGLADDPVAPAAPPGDVAAPRVHEAPTAGATARPTAPRANPTTVDTIRGETVAADAAPPAATASAPEPAAAEPPPPEPEDAPGLLSFQGHLTVQSPVDADVVVQGQPAGRTNQRLLTRCGPRNVRLRDGTRWISPGQHVRIVCMKHTTTRIEPAP